MSVQASLPSHAGMRKSMSQLQPLVVYCKHTWQHHDTADSLHKRIKLNVRLPRCQHVEASESSPALTQPIDHSLNGKDAHRSIMDAQV